MKQYAVYFKDYGCMEDMDACIRKEFKTLDEACKFAVTISKKARYFDVEVVDLFEEETIINDDDIRNFGDDTYIYMWELED